MTDDEKTRREVLKVMGIGAAAMGLPRAARAATSQEPQSTQAAQASRAAEAKRANIVFFLVDDMGLMDSTLYGSKYYRTPNVERLARRGMMFTNAYAANPLCSPTRASILTGKYPCRLGITTPAGHLPAQPDVPVLPKAAPPFHKVVCPRSRRFLPLEEYTLAEAFRDAGYATAFIGKWHLGHDEKWWPKAQGFDINIAGGRYPGPPSYFSPYRIQTLSDGPKGQYITDRLTDEAAGYLRKAARADKPFMMCFWHYAVHAPFQGKEDLVAEYRKRKDPRGKQSCATMGAMIQSMDESLGRLLDTLDKLKLADDTIIIFFSDNGGNMYSTVEGVTPTNNYPLRAGKGNIHEGGVREPCIVVWPGAVKPGSTSDEIISSIDWYPTMLDMAGISKPPAVQFDGLSLAPVLKGKAALGREAIFCHYPHYMPAPGNLPSTSVRKGKFKLIRVYGEGPDRSHGYELYDLAADVGETKNLAAKMPDKVKQLDALITRHLKATGAVVPILNPAYDPSAKPGARRKGRKASKPVAGWTPSRHCTLSAGKGTLRVTCTGGDPYLHSNRVPSVAGPITVKLRMKSTARGSGQFFWTTATAGNFHRSRAVPLEVIHDGKWHEYTVKLPVEGKLRAVRLDPATARGVVEIEFIRLIGPDDKGVKAWEF